MLYAFKEEKNSFTFKIIKARNKHLQLYFVCIFAREFKNLTLSMSFDKTKIVEALAKVNDPVSGESIITMNMVLDLAVDDQNINFTIELPSLNAPSKSELNFACIAAVKEVYPHANVNVHMKGSAKAAQQAPSSAVPHVKNIIAVASGKGGVGKSTAAVNLALGLK